MLLLAIFALVFGLIGTVLGAISTWRTFNRDSVRILVKSGITFHPNAGYRLTVTISNQSPFPVSIIAAGFELKTFGKTREGLRFIDMDDPDKTLPFRLESWDEIKVMSMPLSFLKIDIDRLSFPYAELAGGKIFRSKDMDAVRTYIKMIKEERAQETEPKPNVEQQAQPTEPTQQPQQ